MQIIPSRDDIGPLLASLSPDKGHGTIAYTQLVAEDHSNSTHYLKLSSLLCNGQTCGAYVAGTTTLLAADQDHLTWEAALSIWPELCAFVADAGLLGF